jgi:hypothetical protein
VRNHICDWIVGLGAKISNYYSLNMNKELYVVCCSPLWCLHAVCSSLFFFKCITKQCCQLLSLCRIDSRGVNECAVLP